MLFTTLILGWLSVISLAVAVPDDDKCHGKTTKTVTTLMTITTTLPQVTQTISSLATISVTSTTTTMLTTTATTSVTVTTTTTSASSTTVTAVPSTFPTPVAYGSGCFYLVGTPTYLSGPDFPSAQKACIAACNGESFHKIFSTFSTLFYYTNTSDHC